MRLAFIFGLLIVCLGCSYGRRVHKNNRGSASNFATQNAFNLELLNAVSASQSGNVVVGSSSVKSALMVLAEAAAGNTRRQIISALKLPTNLKSIRKIARRNVNSFKDSRSGTELRSAVKLWTQLNNSPARNFKNVLQRYYRSESEAINFRDDAKSVSTINEWVKKNTNGFIDSIVEEGSLSPTTMMMLTTAVYFKGTWSKSFDKSRTRSKCFKVPRVGCKKVPMMKSEDETYKYADIPELDSKVIQLNYTGDRVAMVVVLPNSNADNALDKVCKKLVSTPISKILKQLKDTKKLLLSLPKFTINNKIQLNSVLNELKITDMSNVNTAFPKQHLEVGDILHNARIEVSEEGTTAAAATGVSIDSRMFVSKPTFAANKPFAFFLMDLKTNDILFAGRFVQPEDQPEPSTEIVVRKLGIQNVQHKLVSSYADRIIFPDDEILQECV